MAQDERADQPRVADRPILVPVEVGAAQSDTRDPDQFLARTGYRVRVMVEPQVARGVEPRRLHGRADRERFGALVIRLEMVR